MKIADMKRIIVKHSNIYIRHILYIPKILRLQQSIANTKEEIIIIRHFVLRAFILNMYFLISIDSLMSLIFASSEDLMRLVITIS